MSNELISFVYLCYMNLFKILGLCTPLLVSLVHLIFVILDRVSKPPMSVSREDNSPRVTLHLVSPQVIIASWSRYLDQSPHEFMIWFSHTLV